MSILFCGSFPGEEGLDAGSASNNATSSKRQSAARRCGGRVNESYGVGSAQSVHSRGMLRVPRSSSRRMSVSTPAIRRFLRTSNRRPRSGWKGWEISAHPKGEWGTSAVCSNRRQTKTWMGDDLQKELAILPTMNQLPCRRAAQGESAEYQWASMVCQLLLPVRSLVADKLDCVELLEPKLRDRNRVKYLPNQYQPWQVVYTAFSVGDATLWVRIVREKQNELQVMVQIHPQCRGVCLHRPGTTVLERMSDCSGVPKSVPKWRQLGADQESLSY